MSARELQRHLRVKSYGRVRGMLQTIRSALQRRDEGYQVGDGVIELDAGTFGRRCTRNQCDVLMAIETKTGVDAQGRERSRAGFAKVVVEKDTKAHAQQLVETMCANRRDGQHRRAHIQTSSAPPPQMAFE